MQGEDKSPSVEDANSDNFGSHSPSHDFSGTLANIYVFNKQNVSKSEFRFSFDFCERHGTCCGRSIKTWMFEDRTNVKHKRVQDVNQDGSC